MVEEIDAVSLVIKKSEAKTISFPLKTIFSLYVPTDAIRVSPITAASMPVWISAVNVFCVIFSTQLP